MAWLVRRRFLMLLLALILLLVVYPVLWDYFAGRVVLDLLVGVVFICALWVIFNQRRLRIFGIVLAIPPLIGNMTGYVTPGMAEAYLPPVLHICAVLFLCFAIASILQSIHAEKNISADSIYGAFCGYLLAGLAFGHLFCIMDAIHPNSFQGTPEFTAQLQNQEFRRWLLTYFSFITLTTVGYGDITPVSEGARALAMVEAIIGQFYMAVLVAELIGKRVSQALSEQ